MNAVCLKEIDEVVQEGKFNFNEINWDHISIEAKDLISKMLCTDPPTRLTIDGVLDHPWMTQDGTSLNIFASLCKVFICVSSPPELDEIVTPEKIRKEVKHARERRRALGTVQAVL